MEPIFPWNSKKTGKDVEIFYIYPMPKSRKGKFLIAATACVVAAIAVAAFLAFEKNDTQVTKGIMEGDAPEKNDIEEFLRFTKKDFPWPTRVDPDGTTLDFDLFTNPSACVEDGKVVIKSYDMLIIDDVLPLYLAGIKAKPYRLRLEGYSHSQSKNADSVVLKDIETNRSGECFVNQRNNVLRVRVLNFELQIKEKDGLFFEIPMVKIYDEIVKKEFTLTNEEKLLEDEYIVVVRDIDGNEYTLWSIGSTVRIKDTECTLRFLNKKEGVAKLLLKDANGQEFNKTVHLIR
jgi:hypothetical protein